MSLIRMILVTMIVAASGGVHVARAQGGSSVLDLVREGNTNLTALRARLSTYAKDGRLSLADIYKAQCELQKKPGWIAEEVFREEIVTPGGEHLLLPSTCLRTTRTGPALWVLTGIHGEEPAGPNALADSLVMLDALNKRGIPLVVMPLLNPLGYQRNWRYPDVAVYSEAAPGSSVGDSDHLLPDDKGNPRRKTPACRQSAMLTAYVLELARDYPPVLSLDLHEDDLLQKGYLYSQGPAGANDSVAQAIVGLFLKNRFPILMEGRTRFGEPVRAGIVSATKDGSIDELVSAPQVCVNGSVRKGPSGQSVLVIETSSMNTVLAERKKVHAAVLGSLQELWRKAGPAR